MKRKSLVAISTAVIIAGSSGVIWLTLRIAPVVKSLQPPVEVLKPIQNGDDLISVGPFGRLRSDTQPSSNPSSTELDATNKKIEDEAREKAIQYHCDRFKLVELACEAGDVLSEADLNKNLKKTYLPKELSELSPGVASVERFRSFMNGVYDCVATETEDPQKLDERVGKISTIACGCLDAWKATRC